MAKKQAEAVKGPAKGEISEDEYEAIVFEDGGSLVVDMENVEAQTFEAMPKGKYHAIIADANVEESKSSGAPMYVLDIEIESDAKSGDTTYAGRKRKTYLSFSRKALGSTKAQLLRLDPEGPWAGRFYPEEEANRLRGLQITVTVGHEDFEGEKRDRIQGMRPRAASTGDAGGYFSNE